MCAGITEPSACRMFPDVLPVKKELAMRPQGLMMSDPFLTDSIHEVSNSDSVCDYMTWKTFFKKQKEEIKL